MSDTDTISAPPVPPDCDLRKYSKMPLDVVRLKGSDIHVECSAEEKWYALELWMASFHQVPASSLPDDDAKLAYLAGLGRDKRTWKRVRAKVLRGWRRCATDGRLYHPVMAEICLDAWNSLRARKRGAKLTNTARWKGQDVEKQQNQHRSPDRSIYNERQDSDTLGDTVTDTLSDPPSESLKPRSAVATEGKGIPSPLPPSCATAEPRCADAPLARPTGPPAEPELVQVTMPTGAEITINRNGGFDEVWAPRDCPQTMLTRQQALQLRATALAERQCATGPPDRAKAGRVA